MLLCVLHPQPCCAIWSSIETVTDTVYTSGDTEYMADKDLNGTAVILMWLYNMHSPVNHMMIRSMGVIRELIVNIHADITKPHSDSATGDYSWWHY